MPMRFQTSHRLINAKYWMHQSAKKQTAIHLHAYSRAVGAQRHRGIVGQWLELVKSTFVPKGEGQWQPCPVQCCDNEPWRLTISMMIGLTEQLKQLLEQQLISQGGHQLFSLSLISITLAMIIHDIVYLPLIYLYALIYLIYLPERLSCICMSNFM